VSREYVIAIADASPIMEFPTGIEMLTIRAGRRYSTAEAVVKQHPELFSPMTPVGVPEPDNQLGQPASQGGRMSVASRIPMPLASGLEVRGRMVVATKTAYVLGEDGEPEPAPSTNTRAGPSRP
jgi:hypothetical protein